MRFYLAILCAASIFVVAGCNSDSAKAGDDGKGSDSKSATKHLEKLIIEDTTPGTGPKVEKGDEVWVKYKGKLADGTVFDETKADADPFHVTVGAGSVIKGWDEGLVGMQKGGKRKLSIPYTLAYNDRSMGNKIKPKSDLFFDIELVDMVKAADDTTLAVDIIKDGSGQAAKVGDTVTIDYEAFVFGKSIESTKDLGKHLTFKLGEDGVAIHGFDETLKGMKVGGERKITVPPPLTVTLANDQMRQNKIVFDVRLLSIK